MASGKKRSIDLPTDIKVRHTTIVGMRLGDACLTLKQRPKGLSPAK
jgi:hypothetical protein